MTNSTASLFALTLLNLVDFVAALLLAHRGAPISQLLFWTGGVGWLLWAAAVKVSNLSGDWRQNRIFFVAAATPPALCLASMALSASGRPCEDFSGDVGLDLAQEGRATDLATSISGVIGRQLLLDSHGMLEYTDNRMRIYSLNQAKEPLVVQKLSLCVSDVKESTENIFPGETYAHKRFTGFVGAAAFDIALSPQQTAYSVYDVKSEPMYHPVAPGARGVSLLLSSKPGFKYKLSIQATLVGTAAGGGTSITDQVWVDFPKYVSLEKVLRDVRHQVMLWTDDIDSALWLSEKTPNGHVQVVLRSVTEVSHSGIRSLARKPNVTLRFNADETLQRVTVAILGGNLMLTRDEDGKSWRRAYARLGRTDVGGTVRYSEDEHEIQARINSFNRAFSTGTTLVTLDAWNEGLRLPNQLVTRPRVESAYFRQESFDLSCDLSPRLPGPMWLDRGGGTCALQVGDQLEVAPKLQQLKKGVSFTVKRWTERFRITVLDVYPDAGALLLAISKS